MRYAGFHTDIGAFIESQLGDRRGLMGSSINVKSGNLLCLCHLDEPPCTGIAALLLHQTNDHDADLFRRVG